MHTTDPRRNTPTEEGTNNDPDLRDESAVQPGTSTISNSEFDEENDQLTETAKDDFRTTDFDPGPDRSFDETDEE